MGVCGFRLQKLRCPVVEQILFSHVSALSVLGLIAPRSRECHRSKPPEEVTLGTQTADCANASSGHCPLAVRPREKPRGGRLLAGCFGTRNPHLLNAYLGRALEIKSY